MLEIDVSADEVARTLTSITGRAVCLLDSCGVGRRGSNLLIGGSEPIDVITFHRNALESIRRLDDLLKGEDLAAIFTLSYDLGRELNRIGQPGTESDEPLIYVALFDALLIHDYDRARTWIAGNERAADRLRLRILAGPGGTTGKAARFLPTLLSNFSQDEYLGAVEHVKEMIRAGETYQTNLTQRLTVSLPDSLEPQDVFLCLRRDHPAAFAAFLDRGTSTVVSASPEQFFRIDEIAGRRRIIASPIKGTRPRGRDRAEDLFLRNELLTSAKDRAENTMIVDLMRNDLGRVCEFGSVAVKELCRLEEHPTLFHLVSTVTGTLRKNTGFSEILQAAFPCGSITGAPKVRTMQLIDQLEGTSRGLSMGAIGCRIPRGTFGTDEIIETSVAIRTMVIRDREAVFNVGGGIVIDSDAGSEYAESMLKAKALLRGLGLAAQSPALARAQ